MKEYGKYHILEGIYPHIGLHVGLLADGNIHNIKLLYRYISNNDGPVKTLLLFVGYIMKIALTLRVIVGHPEPEKNLLAFLSTFWHPCSKCILMCFKKDRDGCQVWKYPKVPKLGQRSTECKFLYIRQILAFLSTNYPKL